MLKTTGNAGFGLVLTVAFVNVIIWLGVVWGVFAIFDYYFHTPWSRG